jgi:Tfp pilus assembly protein FimT
MAIMALLFYISMPAFEKLAKGYGLEGAAGQMAGSLKLARDKAITEKQYVALLLPHRNAPGGGGGIPSDYIHRAYRMAYVTRVTSSNYTFVCWIPGYQWEFLPTGSAILEADSDYKNGAGDTETIDAFTSPFKVNSVDFSDISGPSSVNDVLAVVFQPTGETGGSQSYVTLGEAVYSGGNLVYTNSLLNTQSNHKHGIALLILSADQYTGRIIYGPTM